MLTGYWKINPLVFMQSGGLHPDHLHRAFFHAGTAAGAQRMIHPRQMVRHLDGAGGTHLLADTAADAAGGADRLDRLAEIVGGAAHLDGGVIRPHPDDLLGACRHTLAAAKALCDEYLAAAGEPDGRKFYFGQVTACK